MSKLTFKISSLIEFGLFLFFPWRDALAIMVGSTPIRFGEIWIALIGFFGFRLLVHGRRSELSIVTALAMNLIVTFLGYCIYGDQVDQTFAIKFIVRNIVYLFAMYGLLASNLEFTTNAIRKAIEYLVIVELATFIVIITTGYHLYLGKLTGRESFISNGQYISLGRFIVPRFMGTMAEAGYLAPILVIPIYYFLNQYIHDKNLGNSGNKSIFYFVISLILAALTFSTATYVFTVGTVAIAIIQNHRSIYTLRLVFAIIIAGAFGIFVVLPMVPVVSKYMQTDVINKIAAYFGNQQVSNWSANDRAQHRKNALHIFLNSNLIQFFIGHGTGYYYNAAKASSGLMVEDVNEAYNLYLSTLTDRGILGLACEMGIVVYAKRHVTSSIESKAIYCGILFQFIHWMLTGNLWLYTFWYELIFLVGLERFENKSEENTQM